MRRTQRKSQSDEKDANSKFLNKTDSPQSDHKDTCTLYQVGGWGGAPRGALVRVTHRTRWPGRSRDRSRIETRATRGGPLGPTRPPSGRNLTQKRMVESVERRNAPNRFRI